MKKTICLLLSILICCFALASCGEDSDVPEGYKLVSENDVAYRFYAPTNWNINNQSSIDSVFYSAADPSLVMVTFYSPSEENADIDTFWTEIENQYKTVYTDYTLLENRAATTLGTRNAVSYTFTAKIGGADYKVTQVITGYGKYYYTMTYMSTPENYDSHLEEFHGMMSVFKFR